MKALIGSSRFIVAVPFMLFALCLWALVMATAKILHWLLPKEFEDLGP